MIEFLLQFGISNLCVALALALVAWAVHATRKQPFLAYGLWLLVLAKLVTPPILTIPVVPIPELTIDAADALGSVAGLEATSLDGVRLTIAEGTVTAGATAAIVEHGKTGLVLLWVLGSAGVLAWSLVRIYRFNRLLRMASEVAPPELQDVASEVAQRLGLKRVPTICTTSARLSPMVWWLGGRVRIVIPAALPDELDARQLRWILAHELAHVRRRDHLVRWLEWLACVCFWWNPVAWWARRNLRINEEICCDALVLSSLQPQRRSYANSLMTVVEFLAAPVIRPPAMASEINSGGSLERRFRMIVSNNPIPKTPRWLVAGVLLSALVLLPLGVAYAQERAGDKGECDDGMQQRIAGALSEAGIEREIIGDVMGAMKRIAHEMKVEGGDFELDPRLREYLVSRLELTDEQIELVVGLSRRLLHAEDNDDDMWRRVAGALHEGGIPREKIPDVMGAMKRIVHEMKAEGEDFELDPRLREHLVSRMELTDEQIELVIGLSQRVAAAEDHQPEGEGDRTDEHNQRIMDALIDAGIPRDKLRSALGAVERIAHEIKEEGDAFELNPRLQDWLEREFTAEQIETLIGIAQRLAKAEQ